MGMKGEQQGRAVRAVLRDEVGCHPFYWAADGVLREHGFDRYAEEVCARFYHPVMGRPGLAPANYFRSLLVGYFEASTATAGSRGAWQTRCACAIYLGLPKGRLLIRLAYCAAGAGTT